MMIRYYRSKQNSFFAMSLVFLFGGTLIGLVPANLINYFFIPGYSSFTILGYSFAKSGFCFSPIFLLLGFMLAESSGYFLLQKLEEWTN